MKKMYLFFALLIASINLLQAQDNVAYSNKPPGGIAPADAPMFVILGWDDNSYSDGMNWFLDFIRTKKNKNGTNARTTFFNTTERASTLVVAENNQTVDDVLNSWKTAYNEGHEIANHTVNHPHGKAFDGPTWYTTINDANTWFKNNLGIGKVYGFRTPYLEFGAGTFDALRQLNMYYDCSIEFGYGVGFNLQQAPWYVGFASELGRKEYTYWPFTLDAGAPAGAALNGANVTMPGVWEFMVNTYLKPGGGEITGFDYNVFAQLSASEVYDIWKYNFDLQRAGNKAPFMVNVHTDYYSNWNTDAITAFTKSTVNERRKAIEDFVNYVLQFDDVRVVPAYQVIEWMKNPVAYQNDNAGPFTLNITATNGTVSASPQQSTYPKGTVVTLTAVPNTDYAFTGWSGGATGTSTTVQVTMNANTNVTANFKYQPASCANSIELLSTGSFAVYKDAIGSTATLTDNTPTKVSVAWTMPKRGTDWPWLNLDGYLPSGTMDGACSIAITYKSDQPLVLSLPQAPLSETGESYMIKLGIAATSTTISKDITAFAQPSWATTVLPIDLSKVSGVSVSPDVDTQAAGLSGSFEISSLKIYGLGATTVLNEALKGVSLLTINSSNLILTSEIAKEYSINLYTIDGKKVFSTTQLLNEGQNNIAIGHTLTSGIYMINIQNDVTSVTEKLFIK